MNSSSTPPFAAIDVTRLVGRYQQGRLPTGVDRVSLAYVAHFRSRALAMLRWRWTSGLFSRRWSQALFDLLLAWQPNAASQRELSRLLWWGALSTITQTHRRGLWLFHTSHQGLESARFAMGLRWHNFQPVFFLHDLIPITHPEFCRPQETEKHQARLRHMLAWGRGLVVNSQYTADELHAYAARKRLSVPPIVVAPLAPSVRALRKSFDTASAATQEATDAYFLAVGTIEPRKNIPLLLRVWHGLIAIHGSRAPRLIVVGQMGWEDPQIAVQLSDATAWQGRLTWRTDCSDAELTAWMANARALVFPSSVEGYGLPVVEALAAGLPVIANDLPVIREIVRDIPDLLPADDEAAWSQAVMAYSDPTSERRGAQLRRLAGFSPPDWRTHFQRLDAFLDELRSRTHA